VKNGAVFGKINFIPAKHVVAEFLDPGLLKQLAEKGKGFGGDSVLGVVEEDLVPTEGEGFGTLGILGEQVAHLEVPRGRGMLFQFLPRGEINGGPHQGFMEKKLPKGKDGLGVLD
jgi:hypothetical protein